MVSWGYVMASDFGNLSKFTYLTTVISNSVSLGTSAMKVTPMIIKRTSSRSWKHSNGIGLLCCTLGMTLITAKESIMPFN